MGFRKYCSKLMVEVVAEVILVLIICHSTKLLEWWKAKTQRIMYFFNPRKICNAEYKKKDTLLLSFFARNPNLCFQSHLKFGMGDPHIGIGGWLILNRKKHRISLHCPRPFFDLSAQPTNSNNFYIQFGWNLIWGLILGKKQHRLRLERLWPFFYLPAKPNQNRPKE